MSVHSEPSTLRRSERLRTLTKPALEQYESTVEKHYYKINDVKRDVETFMAEIETSRTQRKTLEALYKVLESCTSTYLKNSDNLADYLKGVKTEESENELRQVESLRDRTLAKIDISKSKITELLEQLEVGREELKSRASGSSRSTTSSVLKRKEAKLEAQKARLRHLDEEIALETKLKQTIAKRELDVITSEVNALKATDIGNVGDLAPSVTSEQRTKDYVESLNPPAHVSYYASQGAPVRETHLNIVKDNSLCHDKIDNYSVLNPSAEPFAPQKAYTQPSRSEIQVVRSDTQMVDTFTKHLVKRDLMMSRLSKFDDNPMMFLTWKASFLGIMAEAGASPIEELELLCQSLGPESTKQAKTIKACNADNPTLAIAKIFDRLEKRFGSPELIEKHVRKRIKNFPDVTVDKYHLLYDLLDLTLEILSLKSQPKFSVLFSYFDSKIGVNELAEKLPWNLKEKWVSEASRYKQIHEVLYPPFAVFANFLENVADMKNDPAFQFDKKPKGSQFESIRQTQRQPRFQSKQQNVSEHTSRLVNARKTETVVSSDNSSVIICPLHKSGKHVLNDCVPFRQKPMEERKKIILVNGICFKCCGGKNHRARNCKAEVQCNICKSSSHPTALHELQSRNTNTQACTQSDGLKSHEGETTPKPVVTTCTQVSGLSKSCAKIVPVRVFHRSNPEKVFLSYATIDDQSNQTLATSALSDYFDVNTKEVPYTLVSCSGSTAATGRICADFIIQSLDGNCELSIPQLIECNDLPNNRDEIPSPEAAMQYPHLHQISTFISPVMEDVGMDILIGRDVIRAHMVQEQHLGDDEQPFAQKLPLGWVIVGQICLGGAHVPKVKTLKTFVLSNGRPSNFQPCDSQFSIRTDLFHKTEDDEKIGLSIEDQEFLHIMDTSFEKDQTGHWVAPLPFKKNRDLLPNNRSQALRRAHSLDSSLRRDPQKREHVKDFMQKLFVRHHAEKAPSLPDNKERWYLPMFGIYHPKKPDSIRVVFDSSARCGGTSLNDVLIKGPDLVNSLQGILMRFRCEKYAVLADVEQMFHNFLVTKEHRNYLRFLWHTDSNLDSPLEDFQMTVHVFGNTTSPAVANYGLRKCVSHADNDIQDFVCNNFYVDDGLVSCSSVDDTVDLVKRTQLALYEGGCLRLHKIASNSPEVLKQFPKEDLAKDLKDLDFGLDSLPEQRSLGIIWNIMSDTFTFNVNLNQKPFTRRGVLSVINSLFDPIGFTAPITLKGKLLLREAMSSGCDWDEPLPEPFKVLWENWVETLNSLQDFNIPRMYCALSIEKSSRVEVHVFSDASKEAVASVAFIKVFSSDSSEVSFLLGKAKVAPVHGHTIPRLELCAAVLAIEMAEMIKEQMHVDKEFFRFYTDSQIVLGYLSNESKRFHVYVSNRVSRIRAFNGPGCWGYVTSEQNPADVATRGCTVKGLSTSLWIVGPSFLSENDMPEQPSFYELVDPESDVEIKKQVTSVKTRVELPCLEDKHFERVSTWSSMVSAVSCVKKLLIRKSGRVVSDADIQREVELFIIRQVQQKKYSPEIDTITRGQSPPKNSSLLSLNPILDQDGILRVGGRVKHMKTSLAEKHPIIIPKNHKIALMLTRHLHNRTHHQGSGITQGAIRTTGYWIIGGRRLVNSVIQQCVTCKKLRGKLGWSRMAELPADRIDPGPPFTFVGVDVFGPWPVIVRRTTRNVVTTSKRWCVLFSCLTSRAVHAELIEEMSTSSFINALRRFLSIRGPVRQFRSDRGSNFVGAVKELGIDSSFIESRPVKEFLKENDSSWIFNPPYAHHFGGAWERMIGSCRRILDAILLENRSKDLTHETLSTFIAEVCVIMNNRPLVPISVDPDSPSVLSPSQVLTQKQSAFIGNPELSGFGKKDAMKAQWKLVQHMADIFWRRWRSEYIHQLQTRTKWQLPGVSFKEKDVVLLKDDSCHRNYWPLAIIDEIFPSDDSVVRKVKLSLIRDNVRVSYIRPISEIVRLVEFEEV